MIPMNLQMLALAASSALFATSTIFSQDVAPASEAAADLPRMVRVQAEFIEMPHAIYTKLMADPRASANDTDLRAECAKLIEAGDARIIESLAVISQPGSYATTEDIQEFVYPTEYEPSSFSPSPWETLQFQVGGPPPPPFAFETKNVGSTFEVETQINANLPLIEIRCTPTLVYHVGKSVWSTWTDNEVTIESSKPRFYVLKVRTGTTLVSGQAQMVAALSPQDEQGWMDSSRKVMTFLRGDIITVGK